MAEPDRAPVPAILAHTIPGRTRLRFPDRRNQAAYLGDIARRLAAHPQVRCATPNVPTGSILLLHEGEIEAIAADLPIALLPRTVRARQTTRMPELAPTTALHALAALCVLLSVYQVRRGRLFGTAMENAWNAFNAWRDMRAPAAAAALLAGGAVQAARGRVLSSAASLMYYALSLRRRGSPEKAG